MEKQFPNIILRTEYLDLTMGSGLFLEGVSETNCCSTHRNRAQGEGLLPRTSKESRLEWVNQNVEMILWFKEHLLGGLGGDVIGTEQEIRKNSSPMIPILP